MGFCSKTDEVIWGLGFWIHGLFLVNECLLMVFAGSSESICAVDITNL